MLRPFNTFGPRQSSRAVIPTIITQLAAGQRRIKLGTVQPTRDFNYISDTVAGFIAAMQSDVAIGEVVNLGSGYEASIGDTAQLIAELMGVKAEIETDSVRIRPHGSEVDRLCASNDKAAKLLGWVPRLKGKKGLEEGLRLTIDWFSNPAHLARYKVDRYNI